MRQPLSAVSMRRQRFATVVGSGTRTNDCLASRRHMRCSKTLLDDCKLGLEGIVSKHRRSPYRSGPSIRPRRVAVHGPVSRPSQLNREGDVTGQQQWLSAAGKDVAQRRPTEGLLKNFSLRCRLRCRHRRWQRRSRRRRGRRSHSGAGHRLLQGSRNRRRAAWGRNRCGPALA
jgi:hypothetical protein